MDRRPESQSSYLRVKNHLDEIVEQIRSKDVPLEQALDLYEEAIRLGNSCADLIDMTDFSLEEIEAFNVTGDKAPDERSADDDGEVSVADGEGDGEDTVTDADDADSSASEEDDVQENGSPQGGNDL